MKSAAKAILKLFVFSGCIGLAVALTLWFLATKHMVSPAILLWLWPPSMAGLADPSTTSDKIMVGAFEFGGNFVLYGTMGVAIGSLIRLGVRISSKSPNEYELR